MQRHATARRARRTVGVPGLLRHLHAFATAMRVLVTGAAGFIGSHLCDRLVANGDEVLAVDSFDPFYDTAIKRANIAAVRDSARYRLIEGDIRDPSTYDRL